MMQELQGSYQLPLVLLSILIAMIASYTALDLGSRVAATRGSTRKVWLFAGSISMGVGIWSMHFVAMLALAMPVAMGYDATLVFVSVLPAIVASFLALYLVSRPQMDMKSLLLGGLFIGSGIVSMHYTGMAAMQFEGTITYDKFFVALSVLIALGASYAALLLLFTLRDLKRSDQRRRKLVSAVVMGIAIAGMHYTGMRAAVFHSSEQEMDMMHHGTPSSSDWLAYGIGLATLLILCFTLVASLIDKKLIDESTKLALSQQRYKSLYEHHPDAIFTVDLNGYFIEVNAAVERLLGYREQELLKMRYVTFVAPEDVACTAGHAQHALQGLPMNCEITILRRGGERVPTFVTGVPIYVDEQIHGVYVIVQDITERKRQEQAINHMAYHDELTKLPNRRKFVTALQQAIESAAQSRQQAAVMLLDIDRFKVYNDSFGHPFGDELLQAVAERLQTIALGSALIARLGGDEFTLLVPDVEDRSDAERAAEQVLLAINETFWIRGYEVRITPSIGVALYPTDGETHETLLKNADTAMYRAKEQGNRYRLYEADLDSKTYDRMMLEQDLRRAIEREELTLYYQPQVNVKTRKWEGAEALIRWRHPERGFISPADFIPLAEETGLIVPLGEWVLRRACQQCKAWEEQGYGQLRMGVNLSLRQFQHEGLVTFVQEVLEETGLAPAQLELEITESMTMDINLTIQKLHQLKAIGVQIGIDDFGTGYSSLSYLRNFPIDHLKIDQSFVRDISGDQTAIVSTIITMAHNLHLSVIAEGVETEEQLEYLLRKGCDEAQGYLLSRPIPADEIEPLLRAATQCA